MDGTKIYLRKSDTLVVYGPSTHSTQHARQHPGHLSKPRPLDEFQMGISIKIPKMSFFYEKMVLGLGWMRKMGESVGCLVRGIGRCRCKNGRKEGKEKKGHFGYFHKNGEENHLNTYFLAKMS